MPCYNSRILENSVGIPFGGVCSNHTGVGCFFLSFLRLIATVIKTIIFFSFGQNGLVFHCLQLLRANTI
ncbi:hypothetical protein F5Y02DRAFT_384984 [Annulohypoxylon stygium]|nr:hypothetical protein F5Y02DRAFT_384984 [Annulohypoxylon stygium]